jgi:hypothetical protein
MRYATIVLLAAVMAAPACTTTGQGGSSGRQRNLITLEELEPFQQLTAFDAIQQLRPRWLQARRAVNVRGSGQVYPKVAVDGMPRGELGDLRTISGHTIREIRFLNSADATTRYGTGYAAGVIEIRTKSG